MTLKVITLRLPPEEGRAPVTQVVDTESGRAVEGLLGVEVRFRGGEPEVVLTLSGVDVEVRDRRPEDKPFAG